MTAMNWISHTGNSCPVEPSALVAVDLGDDGAGRIVRYALLSTLVPAAAGAVADPVD